ncbi:hypothetical protein VTK26DRAFT_6 [Humicola hyalothermophila]
MHTIADCSGQACLVPEGPLAYGATPAGDVFMLAAFAALIPPNLYTGLRYKTRLHTLLLIAALLFEVVGHVGKVLLRRSPSSHAYAAVSLMGTHWGAVLVGSAVYLVLPHTMVIYGQEFRLVSNPIYVNLVFFVTDIFALAFQSVGIGFASTAISFDELDQGVYILLGGLAIQALGLIAFFATYRYFRYKLAHRRYILDDTFSDVFLSRRFKIFMIVIQAASLLIFVRTSVRIAVLASGLTSVLAYSQVVSYLLDDTPVLIAALILTVYPAGIAFGLAWAATSPLKSDDNHGRLPLRLRGHRRKESYPITQRVISLPYSSPNTSPRFTPGSGVRGFPGGLPPHPSPRAREPEPPLTSPRNNPVHQRMPPDGSPAQQAVPFLASQESPRLDTGMWSNHPVEHGRNRRMWGGHGSDANRMVDSKAIWE